MNEDQVTALLDRLAGQVPVTPPPVVAVTDEGHRRLRWRRRIQIGIVGAVVLAVAGSTIAVDQLVHDGSGATTAAQAGLSAQEAAILGHWQPVELDGRPVTEADTLHFARQGDRLTWGAMKDCNDSGGDVSINAAGRFIVGRAFLTQMGCAAEAPYTVFDAVTNARRVQLDGDHLTLLDRGGRAIGVFVRVEGPVAPVDGRGELPGRVPTIDDLVAHDWFGPTDADGVSIPGRSRLETRASFSDNPGPLLVPRAGSLSWRGYDGCNWTTGYVDLTDEGDFRTRGNATTLKGCLGFSGVRPYTAVDVILATRQLRIVAGDLRCYDEAGRLIGILRP